MLTNWIDVSKRGAVGDGTTDDTAAVQACLNLVAAQPRGGVVFCPKRYRINGTLTCAVSNVWIVGNGEGSGFLVESLSADLFNFAPSSPPADSDGVGLEGIRFADFCVLPYATTNHTGGAAIRVQWSKGTVIERVRIGDYKGYSGTPPYLYDGIKMEHQSACLIRQCRIATRHYGVALSGQGFYSGQLGASGFPHFGFNGIIDASTIYSNHVAGSVGVLFGGGTGGASIHHTDLGQWETAIRIDKSMRNEINREVFLGPACFPDTASGDGIYIDQNSLRLFHATDFWSAGSGGYGLNMHATQDAVFRGILNGGRVYLNAIGLNLLAGKWLVDGVDIHEQSTATNGHGLILGAGASGSKVTGCNIESNAGKGLVTVAGCNNYAIVGNTIRSNTVAQLDDAAAGANKLVANNLTT